jgi:hypothetical protein
MARGGLSPVAKGGDGITDPDVCHGDAMILIAQIAPNASGRRSKWKWSVTCASRGGPSSNHKFQSCELAVEFALLISELARWQRGSRYEIRICQDEYVET